jgi:hypothetical protein
MKILGLTGLPRSGKDSIADYLCAISNGHGYIRRSFAHPLKQAAAILLGREMWEMEGRHGFDREAILPEWGFNTRWFLQVFGTECLRNQVAQDFWIKCMRNSLPSNPYTKVVITDVRFDNEAALVRELGGTVIEVRRPSVSSASNHVSDKGVVADSVILNTGTLQDLWAAVDAHA